MLGSGEESSAKLLQTLRLSVFCLLWNIHVDYNAKESLKKPIIILACEVLSAAAYCWLQRSAAHPPHGVGTCWCPWGPQGHEGCDPMHVSLLCNRDGHPPDLVSTASKERRRNYGKLNIYKTLLMVFMRYATCWQWKVGDLGIRSYKNSNKTKTAPQTGLVWLSSTQVASWLWLQATC